MCVVVEMPSINTNKKVDIRQRKKSDIRQKSEVTSTWK